MAVTLPIAEASAPACVDPDVTRAGLVSMLLNLVPMQVNRIVLAANDGGQVFVAIAAYGRDVTSTITIVIFFASVSCIGRSAQALGAPSSSLLLCLHKFSMIVC